MDTTTDSGLLINHLQILMKRALKCNTTRIDIYLDFQIGYMSVSDSGEGIDWNDINEIRSWHEVNTFLAPRNSIQEIMKNLFLVSKKVIVQSRSQHDSGFKVVYQNGKITLTTNLLNRSRGTYIAVVLLNYVLFKKPEEKLEHAYSQLKKIVAALYLINPQVRINISEDSFGTILVTSGKSTGINSAFFELLKLHSTKIIPVNASVDNIQISAALSNDLCETNEFQFIFINKKLILCNVVHESVNQLFYKELSKYCINKNKLYLRNNNFMYVLNIENPDLDDHIETYEKPVLGVKVFKCLSLLINSCSKIYKFLNKEDLNCAHKLTSSSESQIVKSASYYSFPGPSHVQIDYAKYIELYKSAMILFNHDVTSFLLNIIKDALTKNCNPPSTSSYETSLNKIKDSCFQYRATTAGIERLKMVVHTNQLSMYDILKNVRNLNCESYECFLHRFINCPPCSIESAMNDNIDLYSSFLKFYQRFCTERDSALSLPSIPMLEYTSSSNNNNNNEGCSRIILGSALSDNIKGNYKNNNCEAYSSNPVGYAVSNYFKKSAIDEKNEKRFAGYGSIEKIAKEKCSLLSLTSPKSESPSVSFNVARRNSFLPKGLSPIMMLKDNSLGDIYKQSGAFQLKTDPIETMQLISNTSTLSTENLKRIMKFSTQEKLWSIDKAFFNDLNVIGQLDQKYVICTLNRADDDTKHLIVLDQHAVDERIQLEKLMTRYSIVEGGLKSHILEKHWVLIDLEKKDLLSILNYTDYFLKYGLKFMNISCGTIAIMVIPECLHWIASKKTSSSTEYYKFMNESIQNIIKEQLSAISENGTIKNCIPSVLHKLLCKEACLMAVKFGETLSARNSKDLLEHISKCTLPFMCAHGRPVLCFLKDISKNLCIENT